MHSTLKRTLSRKSLLWASIDSQEILVRPLVGLEKGRQEMPPR